MNKSRSLDFSFGIEHWPEPWVDHQTEAKQGGFDWLIAGLSVFFLIGLLWSVLMSLVNSSEEI